MARAKWMFDANHNNLLNTSQITTFTIDGNCVFARTVNNHVFMMGEFPTEPAARKCLDDLRMEWQDE